MVVGEYLKRKPALDVTIFSFSSLSSYTRIRIHIFIHKHIYIYTHVHGYTNIHIHTHIYDCGQKIRSLNMKAGW